MSALAHLQGKRAKPARKCMSCGGDLLGQGKRCGPCAADRMDEYRRTRVDRDRVKRETAKQNEAKTREPVT